MFDLSFELPESWEVKTVEQLIKEKVIEKPLDGNHGGIHPKAADYVEKGVPFVMASDLGGGRVDLNSCKFITEIQASTLRKGFSKAGDVLLSHKATIGRTAIVQDSEYDFIILTPQVTYYRVIDESKLSNIYLKAYFDSDFFQSILGLWAGAGSTRAYLGITGQLKLPVIVPPINKQLEIANQIGSINEKIELNRQTNQTLETIAQTLFKSWFVDFDPVKAKLSVLAAGGSAEAAERAAMCAISARDEASLNTLQTEQPEAYAELARTAALFPSAMQDSELGEIPEGWEVGTLGDTYNVVMGQSPKGDTYNELKEGQLFFQGRAEFGWRYPTPRLYTSSPKRVASKGDILMSVRAPVGDLNIALEDCCIGRGLSALRHNSGSTSFTYYQLKSLQTQLDRFNGEGTVFGSINQKDLKGLQVINPCSISIEAFNKFSLSLDKEIESRAIESMRLSELRDTLLPKLLSGELTLPEETPSQTKPPENAMLKKQSLTMGVA